MGLNMKEKQTVTKDYKEPYQKAAKKEKRALLDQFTRLTGYRRKFEVSLDTIFRIHDQITTNLPIN
jgi:hypothetical protein